MKGKKEHRVPLEGSSKSSSEIINFTYNGKKFYINPKELNSILMQAKLMLYILTLIK